MSSLSLRHVSKRFKDVPAVNDVSLEIHSGEFFSILGPSGCGKTTLLRMIAGFESPSEGSIHLADKDVTGISPQHRGIGMVFQNYALFPHMTVFQNVAFGLETKRVPKAEIHLRVERILDAVNLKNKIDRRVPQLSGGEQQRVALARALVVEPAVLLFDEPLSNLDVALRLSTREEIRTLQRKTGITSIYVTHDQSEAMSLSDRIAVMQSGTVVQVGTPSDIYERPDSVFVAEFLGGANLVHGSYDAPSGTFISGLFNIRIPRDKWRDSGSVILAIKPEAFSLLTNPPAEHNAIVAKIVDKEYLGFTTTFTINSGNVSLRATMLSTEAIKQLSSNATVSLQLDWTKVNVFPEGA